MKQKIKTRKSAKKRFKITGSGKVMANRSGKRHLLGHKSPGSKRGKRRAVVQFAGDLDKIRRMLPGSGI